MSFEKIEYPKEKNQFYATLNAAFAGLIEGEAVCTTVLSNGAALLFDALENINWAGFYMAKDQQLLLAPFQGKPACTAIPFGKGVCGTAAQEKQTQLVADVHLFPGHIACDSASNSEIVVPLILNEKVIGVLDIDSPIKNRFDETDKKYLEEFCKILLEKVDFSQYTIC